MMMKTALFLMLMSAPLFAAASNSSHWIATWGASPSPQPGDEAKMKAADLAYENQTLREIVHTSIGSKTVRVRLSNAFGSTAVEIGAVHIALGKAGDEIVASSDCSVTFSGRTTVTIPPNALVLSDPVELDVPALSDLAVSIFLPKAALGAGIHYSAEQTSYVAPGDQTASAKLSNQQKRSTWVFLTGVDTLAAARSGTIVTFGDSITDGARSTPDANHRWPNFLAARLVAHHRSLGVLDAGIGGNRILHDYSGVVQFGVNGLARFDRDVLAQAGVKYVVVLEGINDLGHPGSSAPDSQDVSADDLIAGLKQLIARAHEKGIKIYGATLTPFDGTVFKGYFTPAKEAKRKAINEWIRTGHAFDGVIDFDKAVRDPKNPDHILANYDSGDHLHPNDAGYKAMGDLVPLELFR